MGSVRWAEEEGEEDRGEGAGWLCPGACRIWVSSGTNDLSLQWQESGFTFTGCLLKKAGRIWNSGEVFIVCIFFLFVHSP
jgi:hypothetical protein